MIKNHLLSIIVNNSKSSKCKFLTMMNSIMKSSVSTSTTAATDSSGQNLNSTLNNNNNTGSSSSSQKTQNATSNTSMSTNMNANRLSFTNLPVQAAKEADDVKHRFTLFALVTRMGTYCKNLDPDLTSES
jgi:hypothetical protein